ncbi:MAG: hypothetical protein R3B72_47750 [Polyangiaceae bacterium]
MRLPSFSFALVMAASWLACGSDVQTNGTGGASVGGSSSSSATGGAGASGGSSQGGAGATSGAGGQGGGTVCQAALGDYGDCDLALGWAFDGQDCVAISGCDCGMDCSAFEQDLQSCIGACPDYCDSTAFLGEGIGGDGWGEGAFCDELYTCVKSDVVPNLELVLGTSLSCETGVICPVGEERCLLQSSVTVSPSLYSGLCATTLVEDLGAWYCLVLGN